MITVVDQHSPWFDAQQNVGGDDPAPRRRKHDQQRHRQAYDPPRYQDLLTADLIAHLPGEQVRQRLRCTERDDERQDGRARGQQKVMLGQKRQDGPLQANRPADKCIDDDQQGELLPVGTKSQSDWRASLTHCNPRGARSGKMPRSTSPPAARHSSVPSTISASFR